MTDELSDRIRRYDEWEDCERLKQRGSAPTPEQRLALWRSVGRNVLAGRRPRSMAKIEATASDDFYEEQRDLAAMEREDDMIDREENH